MKTVLYHSADYDGIFCREIARKFLGEEGVTYIGWNFGDPPLDPALLASPIVVMDLLSIGRPMGAARYVDHPVRVGCRRLEHADREELSL